MNFDWKTWCRFCGNAENNVKFESTINIEYFFKISDSSPKICQQCSDSLREFQEFVMKIESTNQLFRELNTTIDLDNFKLNEIREKFNLEILDFKQDSFLDIQIKEDITFSDFSVNDFHDDADSDDFIKEENEVEVRGKRKRKKLNKNKAETSVDDYKNILDEVERKDPKCSVLKKQNRQKNKVYSSAEDSDKEDLKCDPSWSLEDAVKKSKPSKSKTSEYLTKAVKPVTVEVLKIICHVCNEKLSTMMNLEKHCLKEHDCVPQVPCVCGLMLTNYNTYSKHRKKCCGNLEAPFQCDLCEKRYYTKLHLEKHMNLKHKIDSNKNRCKICGKEFKDPGRLRKHEITHLPNEVRFVHTCPQCSKKFPSVSKLNYHIKYIHDAPEKKFTCHLCAKGFAIKACLDSHLISHSKIYNFNCEICNKKFKSKFSLQSHKKVHDTQDKYFCEVCNKGFRRFSCRTKHMVTHSDERPFPCPEPTCNKRFKSKTYAKSHHNETHLGNLRYPCKHCSESFYQTKDRSEHMRLLHPKEYSEHQEKYKFLHKDNREMYQKGS